MRLALARPQSPASLRTAFAFASLVLLSVVLASTGLLVGGERGLRDLRDRWRQHDASGRYVVVEIDGATTAAIGRWPLPREVHGQTVDRLRALGADRIAYDVDFSARSTRAGDLAFANALKASGGSVILPALRQPAASGQQRWLDFEPIPELRSEAFLGAVNVDADGDGALRRMPLAVSTSTALRPSLAALLADRNGASATDFPIDFALAVDSIPRISLVDLLQGRVRREQVAGRRVLIGATAIEIGDRYPIPRAGIVPGVLVQVLATETLASGRAIMPINGYAALPLALMLALFALSTRSFKRSAGVAAASAALLLAGATLFEQFLITTVPIVPALGAIAGALMWRGLFAAIDRRRLRLRQDAESGLPNLRALRHDLQPGDLALAALVVTNYQQLALGLGAARMGDLLARVAERLVTIVPVGQLYRISDETLCWRLPGTGETELDHNFEGLAAILRVPFEQAGRFVDLTVGFGVAAGPGEDAATLALLAAQAAATAQRDGLVWRRHATDRDPGSPDRLSLMGEMHDAMRSGDLALHYQPKFELGTGTITGCEALVRWNHARRGPLPPDMFIPLAEESGRIEELTLWALERALGELPVWRARGLTLNVAVNISVKLLALPTFADNVCDRLRQAGADPAELTLEITESANLHDLDATLVTLEKIRAAGIKLSLDDYGTGHSTLSYLKRLPVDELKIDKCFVQGMLHRLDDATLVRSTIELAHDLGLSVVAEGVETVEQLERLRELGCDKVQGWLIGRAVPADQLHDGQLARAA